jgi:BirA family transcriptional regulator, biotin operon repressor / biotin---[acetyl-CoA-carboxylase] ligase
MGRRAWEFVFVCRAPGFASGSFDTWVPMMVAVQVSRVVRDVSPTLEVKIKWPNDLWLDGKKVGGILCEATTAGYVVAGIGLNCLRVPEVLDQPVTALVERVAAGLVRPEKLIPEIVEALRTADVGSTRGMYEQWAVLTPGISVSWEGGRGIVRGLGEKGELLVLRDGDVIPLYAEDVKVRQS